MTWQVADKILQSRFLLGTALYPSPHIMREAITQSNTQIITVSLRRQAPNQGVSDGKSFWDYIKNLGCHILPNTAGCRSAKEAVTISQMAREVFATDWIKLEVIGDDYHLQPDPFELVTATRALVKQGFIVFAYCTDDLVLCQKLWELGCQVIMPWASPIGSGQGLLNPFALRTLRKRLPHATLIIDAGIGTPSQAAQVMEMGFDGVLVNSAVALAHDPVSMAIAFKHAVEAGRLAHQAGLMPKRDIASPSTPTLGQPFWHKDS